MLLEPFDYFKDAAMWCISRAVKDSKTWYVYEIKKGGVFVPSPYWDESWLFKVWPGGRRVLSPNGVRVLTEMGVNVDEVTQQVPHATSQ